MTLPLIAKCDKNITTEIDCKSWESLLQNISIYKRKSTIISERIRSRNFRGNCHAMLNELLVVLNTTDCCETEYATIDQVLIVLATLSNLQSSLV